jgi:hypothetical protein
MEDPNSMFVDIFRERIGELGNVKFRDFLPMWLHEWIVMVPFLSLKGNPPLKDLAKLSFILTKHPSSNLPEMPVE